MNQTHREPPVASRRPFATAAPRLRVLFGLFALAACPAAFAADGTPAATYRDVVQPFLADYCYGCHGEGAKKGGVSLDSFASDDALVGDRDLWWNALRNVRAGTMPPAGQPKPSPEEFRPLEDWVKQSVLKIDLNDPDPGRVTLRRLNRVEYRNTVRDLMGVDYNTDEEFPADDTGYGFDTIGDVLSVSPLLLEKYMEAADVIVAKGVPVVSKVLPVESYPGSQFRSRGTNASRLTFYEKASVSRTVQIGAPGKRRLVLDLNVDGAFEFDPGKARLVFKADGVEMLREEYGWQDNKRYRHEFEIDWEPGPHELTFELEPLTPVEDRVNNILMRVVSVDIEGPLDPAKWVRPKSFDRFFHADDPGTPEGRKAYAAEVLRRFATKAFRRPVDDRTVDRLVAFAEETYSEPGKTVEAGVARAMVAVLSSPRFLFRIEETLPADGPNAHPLVDEYALASRLSYFLWSTMPDDELFGLASRGELRKQLPAQVKRMMADDRAERMTKNFPGQWLQARDVETVAIDARTVLARDDGVEKELAREQDEFREFLAQREAETRKAAEAVARGEKPPPAPPQGSFRRSNRFRRLFAAPRVTFDDGLRQAMRRETELFFDAVAREDRSLLELLDSDFTFLNERLAKHYGVPDVKGDHMRKVTLPADSPRGGVLTQGTVLVVTSNPTRTSPVKRGLFILENILGTPAPPAPPSVPDLEESEKGFKDREPSLREVLELHRSKPLCNSCHSRMDPLGFGLENFNALGLFREKERNQPLDTAGTLVTGETFNDVKAMKGVLKANHRAAFYRCVTEKLMTYAIGRGVEPTDVESIDRIVARLDAEGGKFSALLMGVIESSPFQKRRIFVKTDGETSAAARADGPGETQPTGAQP